ncbi:MAG: cache domain-containing protein [Pseudomonadota bacterium]
MVKHMIAQCALGLTALCIASATSAAPAPTADDAVAMVKEAAQYIKKNGKEKALAEFNNPKGHFVNGELYIVATALNGTVLANAASPKMIGKNILDIKDSDGKLFVQEMVKVASNKNSGWVNFRWPNPVTQTIESKTTYIERFDDEMLLGGGIYKK